MIMLRIDLYVQYAYGTTYFCNLDYRIEEREWGLKVRTRYYVVIILCCSAYHVVQETCVGEGAIVWFEYKFVTMV